MTFIIEKDGSLSDIKVLRDIGHGTGAEAIRVLKMSPKWIPGKQNNNVVRTLFSIPVSVNNFVK
ncbi:Gram-negative bacterial tonB protein [compost metagenome]